MTDPAALETYRGRWRRVRQTLRLVDPEAEDFATGGLARRVADLRVRALILPPDPESVGIEFDDSLWSWWMEERTDPVTGRSMLWGDRRQPTAMAAVRIERYGDQDWERYLALHRHGGLELGLGDMAAPELRQENKPQLFRLIVIVGQLWSALHLYREVIQHLGVEGPWEISLALRGTEGALLGNLGEGWPAPDWGYHGVTSCPEAALLLRREVTDWPDADGIRALAFSFGGWLEDAWGIQQRRFLAQRGPLAGQFDKMNYPWN